MAGAELRLLHHHVGSRPGQRGLDLRAPAADDDDLPRCAQLRDAGEQVLQHRPPGERVQHLVEIGRHARPLAGGEYHGGERVRGHGARLCHVPLATSITAG